MNFIHRYPNCFVCEGLSLVNLNCFIRDVWFPPLQQIVENILTSLGSGHGAATVSSTSMVSENIYIHHLLF